MKFSTTFVLAAFAALTAAAPTPETNSTDDGTLVPFEAIIGGLPIPDDVYPVFNYENNTATVVFLNATILAEAKASNAEAKRDLSESEQAIAKRDAEANADAWHWGRLRMGQPMYKREAEADAEADAEAWHWGRLRMGQP
ncbi:hypothetical protein OXX79_013630, partial [Metschnikowia pulcherrima]